MLTVASLELLVVVAAELSRFIVLAWTPIANEHTVRRRNVLFTTQMLRVELACRKIQTPQYRDYE